MTNLEDKEKWRRLKFRDPDKVKGLVKSLHRACEAAGPVTIMHVCGTHEQSIARFGLRSLFPRSLDVIMGPGCPTCVTDMPEVDEAVVLGRAGVIIATFGDIYRVPGSIQSLSEAKAAGADIRIVYSPWDALRLARQTERDIVFFATGFETTAVATAAVIKSEPPKNFSVLSAHKYIPPVMEIIAEMPDTRVQGFLAAGHAATITGWKIFERFVERHQIPVVVAGFEPMDILAALLQLIKLVQKGTPRVINAYPRCVTPEGNRVAQQLLWDVFEPVGGVWRGIAHIPNGNLRIRSSYSQFDARSRYDIDLSEYLRNAPVRLTSECICGDIMAGIASPLDCRLYGKECTPQNPVGACMVSSEGTCKIWYEYGGHILVEPSDTPASTS